MPALRISWVISLSMILSRKVDLFLRWKNIYTGTDKKQNARTYGQILDR